MAATREQIEEFVREQYPHGFESGLEELKGRIFGYVRSDDFQQEYSDRLRDFRKRLNEHFGQQMVSVGMIVPLATGESLDWR